MKLKYHLKYKIKIKYNMNTRGINIVRFRRTLNNKDEEVLKKEYLRCRVNAAILDNHKMLTFEQRLINEM